LKPPFELVVVDNGSRDATPEVARALALRGASEELRERIFRNLSSRAADMLREVILGGATRAEVVRARRLLDRSGFDGPLADGLREAPTAEQLERRGYADKGYDYPILRRALRARGITPRIARRGIESRERLGRHRWVVERSFAWLGNFRRLLIRWERQFAVYRSFFTVAVLLVCLKRLIRAVEEPAEVACVERWE